ncbi:MAG: response regulator transcription factor [Campylobacterales bacterium]
MKYKILLIEDDVDTAEFMCTYLLNKGFAIDTTESAVIGSSMAKNSKYDLIVLDINLPDYSGYEVCTKIRSHSSVPIIFVSAQSDCESHIQAFHLGADDFLVKPINLDILSLHIWAILRRTYTIPDTDISTQALVYDKQTKKIYYNQKPLELTAIENKLLTSLLKQRGITISREELADMLSSSSEHRSIDYHIKNLRRKLGDNGKNPALIKTDYGVGYKLV